MTRRLPTGKFSALEPASSAGRPPVRLIVEYEDADDFLADYDEALLHGRGVVQTSRVLDPGSPLQLGLSFPGLVEPLVVEAIVRTVGEPRDGQDSWLEVELLTTALTRLATLVPRIRERDRRVVMPVVNVLIVEDNRHVSELVTSGLAASARREVRDVMFTFQTADNGGAALELLKHKKFDAAIIDIYLPVLDGSTLIRQMRTTLGFTRMPIIGISGGGVSAQAAAVRAGATVFLDKPVRLRHLIDAMRGLIGS
jgi:CheY-like chemotaxis protein